MKLHKVPLRLILALGLACLLGTMALVIDHVSVFAVNGLRQPGVATAANRADRQFWGLVHRARTRA